MTNPTSNYGFVLPTSTDLVTDLPADFEVALQGVDTRLKALQPGTTLGDIAYSSATANTNTRLPIGTSGQVLAVSGGGVPAWTTTADVTPLTTKGDLFTYTTADARLGVGTDGQTLVADSSTATGLKWATASAGSVSSYTPTWTNVTVGNGTQAFSYIQIGKFVQVRGYLTFGSTTSMSGTPEITLPVTSVDYTAQTLVGDLFILDAGAAGIYGKVVWEGTNKVGMVAFKSFTSAGGVATQTNAAMSATSPITWTTNDALRVQFSYEAA